MAMEALRIQGLVGVEESTYGTDATPADTDGIRGQGVLWTDLSPEQVFPNRREDTYSNSLVKAPPGRPQGRIATLNWNAELTGAGAAYSSVTPVRPPLDPLLRACGMSRTHVDTGGSETVTYALADSSHSSATLYCYAGGMLHRLVGVRGTMVWEIVAGMLGSMRFELMGMILTDPIDTAVPSITYPSVVPPAAVGMGLAIVPSGGSSWTPGFPSGEVIVGNDVVRLDDANGTDGLAGFFIPRRAPQFRLTARRPDLTDYPYESLVRTATDHTIDATLAGGVGAQYNRVDIDINAAYLENHASRTEDNGHAALELMYELQDLALVFD